MIDDFLSHLRVERGCSLNTIDGYRRTLRDFNQRFPLDTASRHDIRSHMAALLGYKSPSTVCGVLSTLRSFYRWAISMDLVQQNPCKGIPLPKKEKRLVSAVSADEFELVFSVAESLRDRAMLLILYGSGLRESELISLEREDLNLKDSVVRIRNGKGGKDALIPLSPRAVAALKEYNYTGRPFPYTRQRIWQIITELTKKALGKSYSPHRFRAGCATALLKGGADVRVTQAIMRHSDIDTTLRYLSIDMGYLLEQYERHPRAI